MKTYTISNDLLELTVLDYGATMMSIKYKGREIVWKHDSLDEYINDGAFLCKTIGRYGNRIGKSRFVLNGKEYVLEPNEGPNQLHGGPNALCERAWNIEADDTKIEASIFSPDGDDGFPGNLTMKVTFTLREHAVHIDFEGETDADTVFAPTIHPYFLSNNASMTLNAKGHLEVDSELIPTGKILDCEGDYDFSSDRVVGSYLDDAFVKNDDDYALTYSNEGVSMEVWTDFPAVQVYSGNPNGIAIEPEAFPDSPNHKEFPDTTLHPGDKFKKYCEYRFY